MKLSYRGVQYETNATPIAPDAPAIYTGPAVNLKYRGATYRRGEAAKVERLGAIFKYRGVAYSQAADNQASAPTTAPVVQPVAAATLTTTVEAKARQLTLNHNREIKNRQHSVLARTAANVGFSAQLSNYWNQVQGEVDAALLGEYDRSGAALS